MDRLKFSMIRRSPSRIASGYWFPTHNRLVRARTRRIRTFNNSGHEWEHPCSFRSKSGFWCFSMNLVKSIRIIGSRCLSYFSLPVAQDYAMQALCLFKSGKELWRLKTQPDHLRIQYYMCVWNRVTRLLFNAESILGATRMSHNSLTVLRKRLRRVIR